MPDQGTEALTVTILETYRGRHILEICPNCFVTSSNRMKGAILSGVEAKDENHCAHFVSHVLQIRVGTLCSTAFWDSRGSVDGVTMRVDELFAACPSRGIISIGEKGIDSPKEACLVFVASSKFVKDEGQQLTQGPQKHVGIWFQDQVWQYSNGKKKVTPISIDDFSKIYDRTRKSSTLLFGEFPQNVSPLSRREGVNFQTCGSMNAKRIETISKAVKKQQATLTPGP